VHHPKNQNIRTFDAIDNDVLAYSETARAGAEIFIAGAAGVRERGEKRETVGDRVNQAGRTSMLALSLAA
jgi:hypothetical protein